MMRMYGWAWWWGKTQAILAELLMNCRRYPWIKQLFLRRTFGEIKEVLEIRLPKIFGREYRELIDAPKTAKAINIWDSSIILWYWSDKRSNERYFSMEYDVIAVDEITRTIYEESDFDLLTSRLRTSNQDLIKKKFKPYFICWTNPWGLWHNRVKKLWIDRIRKEPYKPEDFEFIPALLSDNPYLEQADPLYRRRLEALSDQSLKKALLFGDWNIFEWQYFSEYKESDVVYSVPNYIGGIKKTILSMDYWYRAPSAVYRLQMDGDWVIWVSQETYWPWRTYSQLWQELKESYDLNEANYIVADPAIFSKSWNDKSGAEQIMAITGKHIEPWYNSRVDGRMVMKDLFLKNRLRFHKNCVNLLRTIVILIYDDKKDWDLDTKGEDHALDSIRYWVMDLVGLDNLGSFEKYMKLNLAFEKAENDKSILSENF